MSTIHDYTTTSTPEQYVAGLTDLGPGRSKLFGNSGDEYLKVHDRAPRRSTSRKVWNRVRTRSSTTKSSGWSRAWNCFRHILIRYQTQGEQFRAM
jgi:hypothetical protein